jgi:thioredoxin-like negative regulator of GroEL
MTYFWMYLLVYANIIVVNNKIIIMISVTKADDSTALDELSKCIRSGKVCVLFYADWCGHCQHLKPEWSRLKDMHQKQQLAYKLAEIESAAMDALRSRMSDMSELVTVEGFPTISMYDNGRKLSDYAGERTADAMMDNMNTVFQKQHKDSVIVPVMASNTVATVHPSKVNSNNKRKKSKRTKNKKSKSKRMRKAMTKSIKRR